MMSEPTAFRPRLCLRRSLRPTRWDNSSQAASPKPSGTKRKPLVTSGRKRIAGIAVDTANRKGIQSCLTSLLGPDSDQANYRRITSCWGLTGMSPLNVSMSSSTRFSSGMSNGRCHHPPRCLLCFVVVGRKDWLMSLPIRPFLRWTLRQRGPAAIIAPNR